LNRELDERGLERVSTDDDDDNDDNESRDGLDATRRDAAISRDKWSTEDATGVYTRRGCAQLCGRARPAALFSSLPLKQ
jgi:hypothetical protein